MYILFFVFIKYDIYDINDIYFTWSKSYNLKSRHAQAELI